jgi:hypothetical protein
LNQEWRRGRKGVGGRVMDDGNNRDEVWEVKRRANYK